DDLRNKIKNLRRGLPFATDPKHKQLIRGKIEKYEAQPNNSKVLSPIADLAGEIDPTLLVIDEQNSFSQRKTTDDTGSGEESPRTLPLPSNISLDKVRDAERIIDKRVSPSKMGKDRGAIENSIKNVHHIDGLLSEVPCYQLFTRKKLEEARENLIVGAQNILDRNVFKYSIEESSESIKISTINLDEEHFNNGGSVITEHLFDKEKVEGAVFDFPYAITVANLNFLEKDSDGRLTVDNIIYNDIKREIEPFDITTPIYYAIKNGLLTGEKHIENLKKKLPGGHTAEFQGVEVDIIGGALNYYTVEGPDGKRIPMGVELRGILGKDAAIITKNSEGEVAYIQLIDYIGWENNLWSLNIGGKDGKFLHAIIDKGEGGIPHQPHSPNNIGVDVLSKKLELVDTEGGWGEVAINFAPDKDGNWGIDDYHTFVNHPGTIRRFSFQGEYAAKIKEEVSREIINSVIGDGALPTVENQEKINSALREALPYYEKYINNEGSTVKIREDGTYQPISRIIGKEAIKFKVIEGAGTNVFGIMSLKAQNGKYKGDWVQYDPKEMRWVFSPGDKKTKTTMGDISIEFTPDGVNLSYKNGSNDWVPLSGAKAIKTNLDGETFIAFEGPYSSIYWVDSNYKVVRDPTRLITPEIASSSSLPNSHFSKEIKSFINKKDYAGAITLLEGRLERESAINSNSELANSLRENIISLNQIIKRPTAPFLDGKRSNDFYFWQKEMEGSRFSRAVRFVSNTSEEITSFASGAVTCAIGYFKNDAAVMREGQALFIANQPFGSDAYKYELIKSLSCFEGYAEGSNFSNLHFITSRGKKTYLHSYGVNKHANLALEGSVRQWNKGNYLSGAIEWARGGAIKGLNLTAKVALLKAAGLPIPVSPLAVLGGVAWVGLNNNNTYANTGHFCSATEDFVGALAAMTVVKLGTSVHGVLGRVPYLSSVVNNILFYPTLNYGLAQYSKYSKTGEFLGVGETAKVVIPSLIVSVFAKAAQVRGLGSKLLTRNAKGIVGVTEGLKKGRLAAGGLNVLQSPTTQFWANARLITGNVGAIYSENKPMGYGESFKAIGETYAWLGGAEALGQIGGAILNSKGIGSFLGKVLIPGSNLSKISYPLAGALIYPAFAEGGHKDLKNWAYGAGIGAGAWFVGLGGIKAYNGAAPYISGVVPYMSKVSSHISGAAKFIHNTWKIPPKVLGYGSLAAAGGVGGYLLSPHIEKTSWSNSRSDSMILGAIALPLSVFGAIKAAPYISGAAKFIHNTWKIPPKTLAKGAKVLGYGSLAVAGAGGLLAYNKYTTGEYFDLNNKETIGNVVRVGALTALAVGGGWAAVKHGHKLVPYIAKYGTLSLIGGGTAYFLGSRKENWDSLSAGEKADKVILGLAIGGVFTLGAIGYGPSAIKSIAKAGSKFKQLGKVLYDKTPRVARYGLAGGFAGGSWGYAYHNISTGKINNPLSSESRRYIGKGAVLGVIALAGGLAAAKAGKTSLPYLSRGAKRAQEAFKKDIKGIWQPAKKIGKGFVRITGLNRPHIFLAGLTAVAREEMSNPLVEHIGPFAGISGILFNPGREVIVGIGEILKWTKIDKDNKWSEKIAEIRTTERMLYDGAAGVLAEKAGFKPLAMLMTLPLQTLDTFMELRSGGLFVSALANPIKTFREMLNWVGAAKDVVKSVTGQSQQDQGKGILNKLPIAEWAQYGRIFGSLAGFYWGAGGLKTLINKKANLPVKFRKSNLKDVWWVKLADGTTKKVKDFSSFNQLGLFAANSLETAKTMHIFNTGLSLLIPTLGAKDPWDAIGKSAYLLAYRTEETGRSTLEFALGWNFLSKGYQLATNSKLVKNFFQGKSGAKALRLFMGDYAKIGSPFKITGNASHTIALGRAINPVLSIGTGSGMYYFGKRLKESDPDAINEVHVDEKDNQTVTYGKKVTSLLGNYIANTGLVIAGVGGLIAMKNLRSIPTLNMAARRIFGIGKKGAQAAKYEIAYGYAGAAYGGGLGILNSIDFDENGSISFDWKNTVVYAGAGVLGGLGLLKVGPKVIPFAGDLASVSAIAYGLEKGVFTPLISKFEQWLDLPVKDKDGKVIKAGKYFNWREASEPHLFDQYTPWRYVKNEKGEMVDLNKDGIYDREAMLDFDVVAGAGEEYKLVNPRVRKQTDSMAALTQGLMVIGAVKFLKAAKEVSSKGWVKEPSGLLNKKTWSNLWKREKYSRLGSIDEAGTFLGKAYQHPGLTSMGLIGAGAGTWALGEYTSLKNTELGGVNVGNVLKMTGGVMGSIGILGLLTQGTKFSQSLSASAAGAAKLLFNDVIFATARNLAFVIAPLHGVISLTSKFAKEQVSPSAYTGLGRSLVDYTLGAFYITPEDSYLAQKQGINLAPTAALYLDLGSFSQKKTLREKVSLGLNYVDRALWLGLSMNEETGRPGIKGFGDFFTKGKDKGYAKTLLEEGISSTNLKFAVALILAGPLARGAFPNIRIFNAGSKFQAAVHGLEALGLPMKEITQKPTGFRDRIGGFFKRYAHMAWSGTREEALDEQFSGLLIQLLPISAQAQEVLQELINENPNISTNHFRTAKGAMRALEIQGATILDIRLKAEKGADNTTKTAAGKLIGKSLPELKNTPELLKVLADGLPQGTEIVIGLSRGTEKVTVTNINGEPIALGGREVTYEVGSEWGDEFKIEARAMEIEDNFKAHNLTPEQKQVALHNMAKKHIAQVDPVEKEALQRVITNNFDMNDDTVVEMVARAMASPSEMQSVEIAQTTKVTKGKTKNPIIVSTQSLLDRRVRDRDFDQKVRQKQEELGLYSSQEAAGNKLLTTPLQSERFFLMPLRGEKEDKATLKTEKAKQLTPALEASSVRAKDALVSYLRSSMDDDEAIFAQVASKSAEYIGKMIAVEEAYDRVGASGMGTLGKVSFHILGALGLGKKQELKENIKNWQKNNPLLQDKIDQTKKKRDKLKKATVEELASKGLDKEQLPEHLKKMDKEIKKLEKKQKGKIGWGLGKVYQQWHAQQRAMQGWGQGINADDAIIFAEEEGRRLKMGIGEIDDVISKLRAFSNTAKYDGKAVSYLLAPILEYSQGNKQGVAVELAKKGLGVAGGISGLKFDGTEKAKIVLPDSLKNAKTDSTTTSQVQPDEQGNLFVAVDPFSNFNFDLSINNGERKVKVNPNATGEYNLGAGAHEFIHIGIHKAYTEGTLTGDLLQAAHELATKKGKRTTLDQLNLEISEMGDNEILTQHFSGMLGYQEISGREDLQEELSNNNLIFNYAVELYFRTHPQEEMPLDLFGKLASLNEKDFLEHTYNWVKGSESGVRTKEQDKNLENLERIHRQAAEFIQKQTEDSSKSFSETELKRMLVEKIEELGKEQGVAVKLNQRLTSLSAGRNTSVIDYQSEKSGLPIFSGDQIVLDAVVEVGGERYDGAYSWTVGEKSELQEKTPKVINKVLEHAKFLIENRESEGINTYEELGAKVREYLESEGYGEYGYWQKIHKMFGDKEKLHAFSLGHYHDRRPLKGLIREGDVISLEPSVRIPGLIGFHQEITFRVPSSSVLSSVDPQLQGEISAQQKLIEAKNLAEKGDYEQAAIHAEEAAKLGGQAREYGKYLEEMRYPTASSALAGNKGIRPPPSLREFTRRNIVMESHDLLAYLYDELAKNIPAKEELTKQLLDQSKTAEKEVKNRTRRLKKAEEKLNNAEIARKKINYAERSKERALSLAKQIAKDVKEGRFIATASSYYGLGVAQNILAKQIGS
ncbi:MAG: aminopeptidase P family protein, partial [Candidatus Omnitrophica bacterium]|nr:aminopeptidase P family protein [Candidatus Omnitrophota bacterium]